MKPHPRSRPPPPEDAPFSLTVIGIVANLLLQLVRGDVVRICPLPRGRRPELPAAAVAAAAEAAAAVAAGQDPAQREQTLGQTAA